MAMRSGRSIMGCQRALTAATKRSTAVSLLPTCRYASTVTLPTEEPKDSSKQRVVVLGSGWAGYALARSLKTSQSSRVLISPRSHFVFTPLLASTAVGTLEFRAAIEPVRRLGLDEFHQAWASDIDFANKTIRLEANLNPDAGSKTGVTPQKGPEFNVKYDKLVLAVGCYSQTFGIEGVTEHACFLRDVGDARNIRLNILQAFEKASLPTTPDEERRKLLHFAVVGGGPTGIEFAAELHDLVHEDISKLYPGLGDYVSITIYDIAPKVLPMFDQNLASYATNMFRRQGIKVRTEHSLTRIRRDGDVLLLSIKGQEEEVGAGVVVWSTGLMQNPLISHLTGKGIDGGSVQLAKDKKTGSLITDGHMRVQLETSSGATETLPDVYAIGDCAKVDGLSLPATAQVASQQATYLAKRINKGDVDTESAPAFKFRNLGSMAYLGSWKAIHQSKADELKGWPAWIMWRTAYLTKSMSIRNKLLIPMYWFITWVFGRDISRF
ncbi:pyridine nucleotide-disulfide oxidoreductase domain-containing protein [Sarocladium implicatum]|nr:pyridine nucleotide-disulfide oxidoreductase domain-containing protein [Sarocladium implicatum]